MVASREGEALTTRTAALLPEARKWALGARVVLSQNHSVFRPVLHAVFEYQATIACVFTAAAALRSLRLSEEFARYLTGSISHDLAAWNPKALEDLPATGLGIEKIMAALEVQDPDVLHLTEHAARALGLWLFSQTFPNQALTPEYEAFALQAGNLYGPFMTFWD